MSDTLQPPESLEEFDSDLAELESAEDFMNYFGIAFDPAVVHVNRLHILQRFHDYLAELEQEPETVSARFTLYADLLLGAYQDFVNSDARTEKVFRVFQRQDPPHAEIQLNDLMSQLPPKSATTNNPSATDPDAP